MHLSEFILNGSATAMPTPASWGRFCLDLGGMVESLGRAHVMLLHFPIALLLVAAVLDLWARFRPPDRARSKSDGALGGDVTANRALWRSPSAGVCLLFAAAFSAAASGTGWIHAGHTAVVGSLSDTLWWHRWLGVAVAGLCLVTVLLGAALRASRRSSWVFTGALLLTAGLVVPVGHFGASMVHGEGFMTEPFAAAFDSSENDATTTGSLGLQPEAQPDSRPEVKPDERVGPAEVNTAEADPDAADPDAADPDAAEPDAAEPDAGWIEARLAQIRARGAQASWVSQRDALVEVGFHLLDRPLENEDVALLEGLESVLVSLNLAGTAVTTEQFRVVGACAALERLDLQRSAVSDEGLGVLTSLDRLESLNLHSTAVGDAAVAPLRALVSLRRVVLWGTGVTENGLSRLSDGRPGLAIETGD